MQARQQMRILIITPTFLPTRGGAEMAIYELAHRWQQRHQVLVVTPRLKGEDIPVEFPVIRYWDPLYLPKIGNKLQSPWLARKLPSISLTSLVGGARAIHRFRPDVVNVHYLLPNLLIILAVRAVTRLPIVLSFVSRMDIPGLGMPATWVSLARYVAKMVSATVFLTPGSWQAFWGTSLPKGVASHIIPYGADVHRFSPTVSGRGVRQRLGIPSHAVVIFALQRLVPVKRVDLLIQALAHMQGQTSRETRLVIGGTGPTAPELRQMVRNLQLEDKVLFTGFIPEEQLPHYFAMSDIFAFASANETFGIVLVQAMAAGKPIVATHTFAVEDVVEDGKTGVLVEPEDPSALARGLLMLVEHGETAREMGQYGRWKAETEYDWNIIARRYEAVFATTLTSGLS